MALLRINDQFNGSSLDTSVWSTGGNGVTVSGGNASVTTTGAVGSYTFMESRDFDTDDSSPLNATMDGAVTVIEGRFNPLGSGWLSSRKHGYFEATFITGEDLYTVGFQFWTISSSSSTSSVYGLSPTYRSPSTGYVAQPAVTNFANNSWIWLRITIDGQGRGKCEYSYNGSSWSLAMEQTTRFFPASNKVFAYVDYETQNASGSPTSLLIDYITLDVTEPVVNLTIQDGSQGHTAQSAEVFVPTAEIAGSAASYGGWGGAIVGGTFYGSGASTGGDTTLVVANAFQQHQAGTVSLTVYADLIVQSASQAHTASSLALAAFQALTIQNGIQSQSTDSLTLLANQVLTVANASQAHTATSPIVTVLQYLFINHALHGHNSENVLLDQRQELLINSALHDNFADNVLVKLSFVATDIESGDGYESRNPSTGDLDASILATSGSYEARAVSNNSWEIAPQEQTGTWPE